MILRHTFLIVAIPICSLATLISAQELPDFKDATERWIQTRNRISQEKSEWIIDKELLTGSIDTLETTQEILEDSVRISELKNSELNEKIDQANERVEEYEESNQFILSNISAYEDRILSLSSKLPDPLKEEIAPLLRKIPKESSSTTPAPNRLQNVVAISTIIDEFNNDLTLTRAIKPLDDGSIIEVKVLYWGLAGAYASSTDGSKAWIISPVEDEWSWVEEKENPAAIKRLFDVYEKVEDPALASVPFEFKKMGGEL